MYPNGELVPSEYLKNVVKGCHEALKRLGKLASVIEAIRVKNIEYGGHTGPQFEVHIVDPLGTKSRFETDFRFIGSGDGNPSAEDIAKGLCDPQTGSAEFIARHLKDCEEKMRGIQNAVREVLSKAPQETATLPDSFFVQSEPPVCTNCGRKTQVHGNIFKCMNCGEEVGGS